MAERTRRRAAGSSARRPAASRDAGGRLNRDYSDEEYRTPDEGYDGPEPTKGLYTAELVRINDHTKRDEDKPSSVRWLFRLAKGSVNADGDDVSGWMDSQYTTDNTAFREQQMLVATGVIKPNGKVNLPYDGIVKKAKPCTVRVGIERVIDEDGEGSWKGRMQAFLPLRETTAERRGVKRSRDDEDVFDDEDEDIEGEDADDEEETPAPARRSTSRSRRKAEPEPEDEEEDEEEEPEDEDEDEDEDEEDYDPDALAAELEDLSLSALKTRAREEFGVKITRGMKADAIISAVLDTLPEDEGGEDEDDEDEEEEPPPPPKRSARASGGRRPAKTANATSARRKRGSSDEPPF